MPRSIESIRLKAEKRKAKRISKKVAARKRIAKSDLPGYKIAARRMLPKLPPMSKAELRGMLAAAVQETARM